jgi:hypothetical protein
MELNFSTTFARDAEVVAFDSDCRGLELRSGGEIFGGGGMIFARREGLFSAAAIAPAFWSCFPVDFACNGVCGLFLGLELFVNLAWALLLVGRLPVALVPVGPVD